LNNDDCLEDKREDIGTVLCCIVYSTTVVPVICTLIWAVSKRELGPVGLGLGLGFLCECFACFLNYDQYMSHVVSFLCIFWLFCVWLTLPVVLVTWTDSSPKWPIVCQAGCLNSAYSLEFWDANLFIVKLRLFASVGLFCLFTKFLLPDLC